jgi:hypothetical protein
MAEFLLFKWDHSTQSVPLPSPAQLAALPKLFDAVAVQPDGWNWGKEERTNPWFRILAWPTVAMADAQTLLTPLLPVLDVNLHPTTYWQYRAFFPNVLVAAFLNATQFVAWWGDDTRATQIFSVNPGAVTLPSIKMARAAISIVAA